MKVLILGDYSGVNFFLWRGLKELGVDAVHYSRGDGFKQLPAQNLYYMRGKNELAWIGAARELSDQFSKAAKFKDYDIVLMNSVYQFHNRINSWLLPRVLANNRKTVLQNMACSHDYHKFVRKLTYSPCEECAVYDHQGTPCTNRAYENADWESKIYDIASAIVSSVGYEYYEAIATRVDMAKKNLYIPLPVDCAHFGEVKFKTTNKLRILYGKNREGFKGSKHIVPALSRIAAEYKDKVEILMPDRMPFAEYLGLLESVDIVVDQCNTYSYGMNAIIAGALGKIVLTGAEPIALSSIGTQGVCPFINIRPDQSQISDELSDIINTTISQLDERKRASRDFVLANHSHIDVAEKYVSLFTRVLS